MKVIWWKLKNINAYFVCVRVFFFLGVWKGWIFGIVDIYLSLYKILKVMFIKIYEGFWLFFKIKGYLLLLIDIYYVC